ncbi:MAG: hypothetical protein PVF51_05695 [Nitrospirota bacterium]|jgi:hypothetical protein
MAIKRRSWRSWCRLAARFVVLVLAPLAVAAPGRAVEPVEFRAYENGGEYHVSTEAVLHAPAASVRAVLTDFVHAYRLNPSITESAILPSLDQGVVRLRMRIEECLALFCVDVVSVADIKVLPSGDLQVLVIPELSSFRSGAAVWHIQSWQGETRIRYELRVEPDFFIPPLIGRFIMIEKLRNEILTTFSRLECMARIRAAWGQAIRSRYTDVGLADDCLDEGR